MKKGTIDINDAEKLEKKEIDMHTIIADGGTDSEEQKRENLTEFSKEFMKNNPNYKGSIPE